MKQNQEKLYPITFTQYVRPHGETRPAIIERPAEVYRKAVAISEAGYRFEVEILTSGLVSLTIGNDDGDYAYELHHNGPGIDAAVDRLILNFEIGAQ